MKKKLTSLLALIIVALSVFFGMPEENVQVTETYPLESIAVQQLVEDISANNAKRYFGL